jgi:hypothetical protein
MFGQVPHEPSLVEAAQALIAQEAQYIGFGPSARHPPHVGCFLRTAEQMAQFMPHGARVSRTVIVPSSGTMICQGMQDVIPHARNHPNRSLAS